MWKYLLPGACIILMAAYLGLRQEGDARGSAWQAWNCTDGHKIHWRTQSSGVQVRFDEETSLHQLVPHHSPLFTGVTYTNGTLVVHNIKERSLSVTRATDPMKSALCHATDTTLP